MRLFRYRFSCHRDLRRTVIPPYVDVQVWTATHNSQSMQPNQIVSPMKAQCA